MTAHLPSFLTSRGAPRLSPPDPCPFTPLHKLRLLRLLHLPSVYKNVQVFPTSKKCSFDLIPHIIFSTNLFKKVLVAISVPSNHEIFVLCPQRLSQMLSLPQTQNPTGRLHLSKHLNPLAAQPPRSPLNFQETSSTWFPPYLSDCYFLVSFAASSFYASSLNMAVLQSSVLSPLNTSSVTHLSSQLWLLLMLLTSGFSSTPSSSLYLLRSGKTSPQNTPNRIVKTAPFFETTLFCIPELSYRHSPPIQASKPKASYLIPHSSPKSYQFTSEFLLISPPLLLFPSPLPSLRSHHLFTRLVQSVLMDLTAVGLSLF